MAKRGLVSRPERRDFMDDFASPAKSSLSGDRESAKPKRQTAPGQTVCAAAFCGDATPCVLCGDGDGVSGAGETERLREEIVVQSLSSSATGDC